MVDIADILSVSLAEYDFDWVRNLVRKCRVTGQRDLKVSHLKIWISHAIVGTALASM